MRSAANILGAAIDRADTEAALKQSESRYARLVHDMPDGLLTIDGTGVIQTFNPSAEDITGLVAAKVIGKPFFALGLIGDTELTPAAEIFQQIIATGRTNLVNHKLRRADGSYRVVRAKLHVISSSDGQANINVTLRDVTEAVNAEAARELLQRQLAEANRLESLGRLAGGVAHDFNNVLAAITLTCTALETAEHLSEQSLADIRNIRIAAERGAALTNQLTRYAKRQQPALTPISLRGAPRELVGLLRRTVGPEIELELDLLAERDLVLIDRSQLDQVILNLVVNARDALPGGGCIRISTSPAIRDKELWVELSVSDNGIGMDEATRDRIFDPFFTTKEDSGGTGLGLATVHDVVDQNGGHIQVESTPHVGTTVRVLFPISPRSGPDHGGM